MRKSKFTEAQIVMALRQAEGGTPVTEICRKLQITETTFYRWKKKFGGLGLPELRELKQLRDENRRLKGLVADLSIDRQILQEALGKNGEPGAAEGERGVGSAQLPPLRASGDPGAGGVPLLGALPEHQGASGAAASPDPRDRGRPGELGLPAGAYAASPGRLGGESQAGLPTCTGKKA